ncbi:MAG: ATP synthase A1 subunit C [Thermoplasmata archaeon]
MHKTSLSDYAYSCARVRARKSKMIENADYLRLASMDLTSIARYMGESHYRKEVSELAGRLKDVDLIEAATYLNLASTYAEVMGFFRGEDRTLLGYYLNELDLLNLKTIIRGKFRNVDNDEIMADLIPGGDFTGKYMEIWKGASDVLELVSALEGTRFFKDLDTALKKIPDMKTTARMEDVLDKAHYAHVLASLTGRSTSTKLFRDFVRREIDMRNVITLLRVKFAYDCENVEVTADDMYIPGGKELDMETLASLHKISNQRQLLTALEKCSFHEVITAGATSALENHSPREIIREFETHHRKGTGSFAIRNPLSILPIIHYLMLKKNEVFNLRLIARGKEMRLSPDKIRELIII